MKQKSILWLVTLLVVTFAASAPSSAEAAPNPFTGHWSAVTPGAMPDAELVIRGGRHFVNLRLADPYDFLFCASTPGPSGVVVGVEAIGLGVVSGSSLDALFAYRCSDGASGVGHAVFTYNPTANQMVDSASHVWTPD